MIDFKSYYLKRYADWPGTAGESYDDVFKRLCNTVAEYIDESVLENKIPGANDG